jgi:hypothetical protein
MRLRVARFIGQPPRELHAVGDELMQVLAGQTVLTVLRKGEADSRLRREGDVVVVP